MTTETLAEALPREIARVSTIREHAREIGPAGGFLVAMTTASIDRAVKAAASGDVVAMLRALKDLQEYSE